MRELQLLRWENASSSSGCAGPSERVCVEHAAWGRCEAVAAAAGRAIAKYGKLRDECLNANQFLSIHDSKCKIEAWRADYNVPPAAQLTGSVITR